MPYLSNHTISLFPEGANQLTTFLTENGGPGIQHIALHSKNLLTTVELLKTQKLAFIEPPMEYYSEVRTSVTMVIVVVLCNVSLCRLAA